MGDRRTKHDLYAIITEFRRKNPHTSIPQTDFSEPYLLTETENTIIDDMLELLNKHGLTSHQSMNLLERLGRIIEMGQRVAKVMTHGFIIWSVCEEKKDAECLQQHPASSIVYE